jgi:hypothetical protein
MLELIPDEALYPTDGIVIEDIYLKFYLHSCHSGAMFLTIRSSVDVIPAQAL